MDGNNNKNPSEIIYSTEYEDIIGYIKDTFPKTKIKDWVINKENGYTYFYNIHHLIPYFFGDESKQMIFENKKIEPLYNEILGLSVIFAYSTQNIEWGMLETNALVVASLSRSDIVESKIYTELIEINDDEFHLLENICIVRNIDICLFGSLIILLKNKEVVSIIESDVSDDLIFWLAKDGTLIIIDNAKAQTWTIII